MNKYRNKPTYVDGIRFASQREAKRYSELKNMQFAGDIAELELQPVFNLTAGGKPLRYASKRQVKYIADFRYYDRLRGFVIEDVKGMKTPAYKLKWAIMAAMGLEIVEI